jgi:hypothetical protein
VCMSLGIFTAATIPTCSAPPGYKPRCGYHDRESSNPAGGCAGEPRALDGLALIRLVIYIRRTIRDKLDIEQLTTFSHLPTERRKLTNPAWPAVIFLVNPQTGT